MIPLAGFLPATDDRVRYGAGAAEHVDGLEERDCAFLACSFWLADRPHLMDRDEDTRRPPKRLLELRNDLGLWPRSTIQQQAGSRGTFPRRFFMWRS
jgi:hypothetical protein